MMKFDLGGIDSITSPIKTGDVYMTEKPLWEDLIEKFEALLKIEPGGELLKAWGSAIDELSCPTLFTICKKHLKQS